MTPDPSPLDPSNEKRAAIMPGLLTGVWHRRSTKFPDETDYLWIDEAAGRMIDFIAHKSDVTRRFPMRMRLRRISDSEVGTTTESGADERIHEVSFCEGNLVLKNIAGEWELRRLPESEYPEWLEEMVAASCAKMDEKEMNH